MAPERFLFPLAVWRFLAVLSLVIIVWAGFRPDPIPQYVHHFDKWLHAFAFAGVTALTLLALPRLHWLWTGALMLVLGFLIEVGQDFFLPRRTFDWEDLAVDAIGVVAGLLALQLLLVLKNLVIPQASDKLS